VNLILLESSDFVDQDRVRLSGRRHDHIAGVLSASSGSVLRIGRLNGKIGYGRVEALGDGSADVRIEHLDTDPPPPLPLRLILALPRPKVLNRTIAAAASLGIKEIDFVNSWRVEKSYWKSPRLSEENLRLQSILGLEQGVDTMLPSIRLHRLFAPFVQDELPTIIRNRLPLLAHPTGAECPRHVSGSLVLAIGPEGGFIDREIASFQEAGFAVVTLGDRILRVETALASMVGRLF
jgi:RsmE family RNA methyltransferase